jgi:hypothetical protein
LETVVWDSNMVLLVWRNAREVSSAVHVAEDARSRHVSVRYGWVNWKSDTEIVRPKSTFLRAMCSCKDPMYWLQLSRE